MTPLSLFDSHNLSIFPRPVIQVACATISARVPQKKKKNQKPHDPITNKVKCMLMDGGKRQMSKQRQGQDGGRQQVIRLVAT